jgi:aminopeptidase N
MHITCKIPTDKFIFHSKDLTITSISLKSNDDANIQTDGTFEYDNQTDFVIVKANKECIQDDKYLLTVKFTGIIRDDLYGFYKSSYLDKNNVRS